MPRSYFDFVAAMGILLLVGCPSVNDHGGPESPETASNQEDADVGWTTVATLRSSDPPFQNLDNILVSDPFTVTGDVRVVMQMPDAGRVDGVVGVIMPADKAIDGQTLLRGAREGVAVTIIGAAPLQLVSDLDGTYVFVNAVPAPRAWSLEVQVKSD